MQFTGAFSALITPFANGKIDEERYRELIEWQITEGIGGLVPCGTTGESATLSHKEHEDVIKICIDQVKGRVPVIAGSGSNNTAEAIHLTQFAKDAGADAALLITPYYNKPTQAGLIQHYKTIAKEVSFPMILYNVPGRTGVNMSAATMSRLYNEEPNIIGVKEASGDINLASDILEQVDDKFILLSGDDFILLPLLSIGAKGVISVVSNLVPSLYSKMCSFALKNDFASAKKIHFEVAPLCRGCFIETNPIPVKTALAYMKKVKPDMRLPLVPMQPDNEKRLVEILRNSKLID